MCLIHARLDLCPGPVADRRAFGGCQRVGRPVRVDLGGPVGVGGALALGRAQRPGLVRPERERRTVRRATVVKVSALNIAFDQTQLSAPADQPFQIEFANNDPSIPHNVEIKDSAGASAFNGEIFPGVETRTYDVPPLAAGAYPFICSVHPNMTGTLTLQ